MARQKASRPCAPVGCVNAFDLVKAAPADDADGWCFVVHCWAGAFRQADRSICKARIACSSLLADHECPRLRSSVAPLLSSSLLACSCATPPRVATASDDCAASASFRAAAAGSSWARHEMGRNPRISRPASPTFVRATPNAPLATAEIYYNDRAGIEAMAAASELPARLAGLTRTGGEPALGWIEGSERPVSSGTHRRRSLVCGRRRRTSLLDRVAQPERMRLEAVLSVDGLDVIDGRPASLRNRGYVIEPHRTLTVEGFRQSTDAVAAFRFSPVRESYAQEKYRNTPQCRRHWHRPFQRSGHAIPGPIAKCGSVFRRIRFPTVSRLRRNEYAVPPPIAWRERSRV